MAEASRGARIFRGIADGGPGILFLLIYLFTRNFRLSTEFLVGAAVIALAASLIAERRLRPMPAFTGGLAVIFGGGSLILHDPDLLKMKMSIVDGVLGAVLFIGVAVKRNPLKLLLGTSLELADRAWTTLAVRYGLFWWASAAANEVVRRTQSEQNWVLFRGFAFAAALVFALAQIPYILRHGGPINRSVPSPPDRDA